MNDTLFQRLDAIATKIKPDEYAGMLELSFQYYYEPREEFEDVLGEELSIVERRILGDILKGGRTGSA